MIDMLGHVINIKVSFSVIVPYDVGELRINSVGGKIMKWIWII